LQNDTTIVKPGEQGAKVILGGKGSKSDTIEFDLTLSATDSASDIYVILEADGLVKVRPDGMVRVLC